MTKSLIHIIPEAPGDIDGVTSYATLLASTLSDYQHTFLYQKDNRAISNIANCYQLYSENAELALKRADLVILHYVGYAYQKHAIPIKLLKLLWRYKSKTLITIFHELEINRSKNLSSNLLGYLQLKVIGKILKQSAAVITSSAVFKERLSKLDPWAHYRIHVQPVVSNIPEKVECLRPKLRSNTAVVFGTTGRRKAVYENLHTNLSSFESIIDIGPDPDSCPDRVGTIPINKLGELSKERISEELQKARFGLIDYTVDMLSKSSIFATYLSQGVVPVLTRWQGNESKDGLNRLEEFLVLGDSTDNLEHIQFKGLNWYRSHSLDRLSIKIREVISKIGHVKPKVLLIFAHTTQNDAPLSIVTKNGDFDVITAYCSSSNQIAGVGDEWLNRKELLRQTSSEVYSIFPKNISPIPKLGRFFGLINPSLFSLTKKTDVLVVFGHHYFSLFFATLWGRILGKKVVVSTDAITLGSSTIKSQIKKILFPIWYKLIPDQIIVPSNTSELFLHNLGIPRSKISITPYASDEEFLLSQSKEPSARNIREMLGIDPESFVALTVAKMIERKNLSLLIKAWTQLPNDRHLIMVGDGPLRKELEELAANRANIHFAGLIQYQSLPSYYSSSDILIHPAKHEPWGLPINEAMILGKPVIASDAVGAAKDLIVDTVTGWTFKSDNLEDLINVINKAEHNRDKLSEMGEAARHMALSKSSASNASALLEVFKKLA